MAQSRRKVLELAVCASCHEAGFSTATEPVIETLTVMIETLITEIGRTSQMLTEHNGRCESTPGDVFIALIEMGLNVDSILKFANQRDVIFRIPTPAREPAQKKPTILHTGQTRPLHHYIPDYFPPFPDAHSYIRTPTQRQPTSEYEAIRDKAASQKRDLERALTRFVAKTCESNPEHSLFATNNNLNKYFPLITIRPSALPFLDALLPKDQIFDDEDEAANRDRSNNLIKTSAAAAVAAISTSSINNQLNHPSKGGDSTLSGRGQKRKTGEGGGGGGYKRRKDVDRERG